MTAMTFDNMMTVAVVVLAVATGVFVGLVVWA
jgi:hypothetical protein